MNGVGRRSALVLSAVLLGSVVLGAGVPAHAAQTSADTNDSEEVATLDRLLESTPPGEDIVIGDMIFERALVQARRDLLAGEIGSEGAGSASPSLWPNGNVYYSFAAEITAVEREQFLDAALEWAAFAKLSFIPRTAQVSYIQVTRPTTERCDSFVGMVRNRAQVMNLAPGCFVRPVLLHEIGHALGLEHEHQRADRDTYVTVHEDRLSDADKLWYKAYGATTNWSSYDFLSIMHYGAVNKGVTVMEPKPGYGQYLNEMGRQTGLSRLDRASIRLAYGPPAQPPGAIITNTRDSGPGTLRSAIYYAADRAAVTPGTVTTLQFRIPTSDPGFDGTAFTIRPTGGLPPVGDTTIIDGASQALFTGNTHPAGPEVVLSGSKLTAWGKHDPGLLLKGVNSSVRMLVIHGFPGGNVVIKGPRATGNSVLGNYIGTNRAGTAAGVPPGPTGVSIVGGARGNTIGGLSASARNVISGNNLDGVVVEGAGTDGNVVQGNHIGLNGAGSSQVPNRGTGVMIRGGARSNVVGGTTAGARNVISGNLVGGVGISGAGTSLNRVEGNYVGTDGAGSLARGNGRTGIFVAAAAHSNVVGGTTAGTRNLISGNAGPGVTVTGAGTNLNRVEGNYIGTDPTAAVARANTTNGVYVDGGAQFNVVGGRSVGARNVISGNTWQGVAIVGAGTNSNRVEGNFIGTTASGAAALRNGTTGVSVYGGAQSNVIGGTAAGAGNTVSGNGREGVLLSNANTRLNLVQGNRIGLNAAGTAALANGLSGVGIFDGASSNTVGGAAAAARNHLSGNTEYGVVIGYAGTTGNMIYGNTIGRRPAGEAAPNRRGGILLFAGTTGNQIGGVVAGTGNTISANNGNGVSMWDAATVRNPIRGNSFWDNAGQGIGLAGGPEIAGGVTPNDLGDGDTGPNQLQNFPVLRSAVSGTGTSITASLNSAAGTTFRIEYFSVPTADAGGYGEGATYLGARSVTTDTAGNAAPFTFSTSQNVPVGHAVTATATDPAGNTSEFSLRVLVTSSGASAP